MQGIPSFEVTRSTVNGAVFAVVTDRDTVTINLKTQGPTGTSVRFGHSGGETTVGAGDQAPVTVSVGSSITAAPGTNTILAQGATSQLAVTSGLQHGSTMTVATQSTVRKVNLAVVGPTNTSVTFQALGGSKTISGGGSASATVPVGTTITIAPAQGTLLKANTPLSYTIGSAFTDGGTIAVYTGKTTGTAQCLRAANNIDFNWKVTGCANDRCRKWSCGTTSYSPATGAACDCF